MNLPRGLCMNWKFTFHSKMRNFQNKIVYLFLIILSLTPLVWFKDRGNALLNGVDTNFPLNPLIWLERRFFVWNDANAGSDFSSSTSGIFFHSLQALPYKLGFSLQQVQLISFIFWFLLIVFSAYVLARVIFKNRYLVQLLFVVIYSFNIYLFNTWENVKVANLSLVAGIPLALALFIQLKRNAMSKSMALILSSLIGIVISGSGINPSYFITFLFVLVIFVLSVVLTKFSLSTIKKAIIDSCLVIIPIVLVNLFWLLPTFDFVFRNISPEGSIDKIGFTNWVDSLSKDTSILNVIRLQGAWDWYAIDPVTGLPFYIPYALNYFYRQPFILFSFILPATALLALVARRRNDSSNYLYLFFGLMLVIGTFLCAGTHLPTGDYFRWLSNNLPFFTFFRSPWYIFSPLVVISLAGLTCLFFYYLLETFGGKLKVKIPLSFLLLILMVGNLIYSYPMITGKIFRPNRSDGFYVEFPPYVLQAQDWLSSLENDSRIIGYPGDEIERFKWGYRGIDSILSLLSDKELLYSSLNAPNAPIALLIQEFYKSLARGEVELTQNLAYKIGAGILFDKRDQESLAPKIQVKDWPYLANLGNWYFYKLLGNDNVPKLGGVSSIFIGYPYSSEPRMVGLLGRDQLLLNPDDTVFRSIDNLGKFVRVIVRAQNSQTNEFTDFNNSVSKLNNRLLTRDLSIVFFDFNILKESVYQPILDRNKLEDFGLEVTIGNSLKLELDGIEKDWKIVRVTDSFVYFDSIELSAGQHKISLALQNKNLIAGGNFEGPFSFDHKFVSEIRVDEDDFGRNLVVDELSQQAEIKVIENNGGHSLSVLNKGSLPTIDLFADFKISDFDPQDQYLVEFKYQQIYGSNASVIVFQGNADTLVKSQTERLPNYPQMNNFSFFFEPVKTESEAKVALLAPFINDPLGTRVLYDDLTVYKVFKNQMFFMESASVDPLPVVGAKVEKKSPVLYEAVVSGAAGPHLVYFAENYSPFWEMSVYNTLGQKLDSTPSHFSGNLFANVWYVEEAPEEYNAKFFYKPQLLFWLGLGVSAATLIFSLVLANSRSIKSLSKRMVK